MVARRTPMEVRSVARSHPIGAIVPFAVRHRGVADDDRDGVGAILGPVLGRAVLGLAGASCEFAVRCRHEAGRRSLGIARSVNPGQVIAAGQELFVVTDLGTVWVMGDIYEKDFAR